MPAKINAHEKLDHLPQKSGQQKSPKDAVVVNGRNLKTLSSGTVFEAPWFFIVFLLKEWEVM